MSSGEEAVTQTGSSSPTSWRDVYQLVQDVEGRLAARMNEIANAASAATNDHEIRLRVLEKSDSSRNGGDRRVSTVDATIRGWVAIIVALAAVLFSVLVSVSTHP